MNRHEALRLLGLEEGAAEEEIRAAYKESAQIMHPDRFAGNKRLQERATEQFKNLQEAYETLGSGAADDAGGGSGAGAGGGRGRRAQVEARLAGIAAAREQLVAQRDAAIDRRQRGLGILVAGLLVAVCLRRIVWLAGIGGAVAFWGGYDFISAHGAVSDLNKQLADLARQRKRLEAELEDLP